MELLDKLLEVAEKDSRVLKCGYKEKTENGNTVTTVELTFKPNEEVSEKPQNKALIKEIERITDGVILPTVDGKEYVLVFNEVIGGVVAFNVVGDTIYVSGTGHGERLANIDNRDNPISLDVVKLFNTLLNR